MTTKFAKVTLLTISLVFPSAHLASQESPTPEGTKAYRTLNFGDSDEVVNDKLQEMFDGGRVIPDGPMLDMSREFWSAIFPIEAEFAPFKEQCENGDTSKEFGALYQYFRDQVGVTMPQGLSDSLKIRCYTFGGKAVKQHTGLALVQVQFIKIDRAALISRFTESYPGCQQETQELRIPSDLHPGVEMVFTVKNYRAVTATTTAQLTVYPGQYQFICKRPAGDLVGEK
jgi:hypothetical protein